MPNQKQYLIDETKKQIEEATKETKKSDIEIEVLEAKLKVENKMSGMEDIPEELKEDVRYSIQALENMLAMEKNRNEGLKKELKMLQYRKQVINKFEEEDF